LHCKCQNALVGAEIRKFELVIIQSCIDSILDFLHKRNQNFESKFSSNIFQNVLEFNNSIKPQGKNQTNLQCLLILYNK
jgi:hypothetical protein